MHEHRVHINPDRRVSTHHIIDYMSRENLSNALNTAAATVHVPAHDIDGDDILENLKGCEKRTITFYDENLPIYVMVRSPRATEAPKQTHLDIPTGSPPLLEHSGPQSLEAFKEAVEHLSLEVETHVTGNETKPEPRARSFLLYSGIVKAEDIVFLGEDKEEHFCCVWKSHALLEHPRSRLQQAKIKLTINSTLVPEAEAPKDTSASTSTAKDASQEILKPFGYAVEQNIFETLQDGISIPHSRMVGDDEATKSAKSPPMKNSNPSLPRSGHARGLSIEALQSHDLLNLYAMVEISIIPCINLRLRTTKSAGVDNALIVSLELECNGELETWIHKISVSLPSCDCASFGQVNLPLKFSPGDSFVMAYKLTDSENMTKSGMQHSGKRPISICLDSEAVIEKDAKANPRVTTSWNTQVDFSIASPPGASLLRSNSASISNGSKNMPPSLVSQPYLKGNTSSITVNVPRTNRSLAGMVISFSGTSSVKVGESFKWRVFVVNKSGSVRRMAMYVQPKERYIDTHVLAGDIIPVVNRQALKAAHNAGSLEPTGILALANDIKLGPLSPHECYETDITMVALSVGIFSLEGVKIVDTVTGDSYDCGKLMEVVVSE
ncbi:YALI0B12144p [Yarrowia lipolytica CLIB122]|uniref:YALI0B12144p n=3 Tax=Yarrowia lipolytica TaxID=4952 RepID=Q6CEX5_YARLI|nr:YALI0B12144p [Yarrowia lipolytica CLIB122]AOW01585.1 hypothetical protein YALI1_B15988g [Yarrowia lipolytica]KAJ8052398.1 TRAPP trafficking subunit Trs65-domain-containing protein [Yarrowia lipolytica]CAG83038.1 YALI0B12144p [Yarrowia lipolytica CLIB122]SEI30962.1 YALIA101S01e11672g1_1 [Yarrowia lipolytica]VBB85605.1 Conserved hypothetical protein [Yarrowia lipolytica]|eukprot:XP_500787.1 YALI0B12144p [Yarrowia lipolytica CLIB122]